MTFVGNKQDAIYGQEVRAAPTEEAFQVNFYRSGWTLGGSLQYFRIKLIEFRIPIDSRGISKMCMNSYDFNNETIQNAA